MVGISEESDETLGCVSSNFSIIWIILISRWLLGLVSQLCSSTA